MGNTAEKYETSETCLSIIFTAPLFHRGLPSITPGSIRHPENTPLERITGGGGSRVCSAKINAVERSWFSWRGAGVEIRCKKAEMRAGV